MEQITKRLMSWASILEDNTREQALTTSAMPFVQPHLALMPDAHLGKGSTVGSVIPTRGAVMPAAVGVDIGCGMMAVRTQFTGEQLRGMRRPLSTLRGIIEAAVPVSAGVYNQELTDTARVRTEDLLVLAEHDQVDLTHSPSWDKQLGTLGGGNHFIEVSTDEADQVWAFLHSGSRGVGNKIAQRGIKDAQRLMAKWFIELPDRDLAYLPHGVPEFWTYINAMRWAQEFAYQNRAEMMDRVLDSLSFFTGEEALSLREIACHHNYTTMEDVRGVSTWVTRKGAIDAHEGVWGLIPGSMGEASYVVQGKGNELALNSAPHGAGRLFSRRVARDTLSHEGLRAHMAERGIEWRDDAAFVDEAPGAYKDIDVVMFDARDLVDVRHTLRQLVNVKGQ